MFRGVLSNGLPFLRPVMLVSTMCGDRAQVSNEGKADEELHVVKDGHQDTATDKHSVNIDSDAQDSAAQYGILFPRLLAHVLISESSSGWRVIDEGIIGHWTVNNTAPGPNSVPMCPPRPYRRPRIGPSNHSTVIFKVHSQCA